MKQFFGILAFTLSFISSTTAQVIKPISWEVSLSQESPKVGDTINVVFDAQIDADWYLYSSDFDPNLGPMVTRFQFEDQQSFDRLGETAPLDAKRKYDSLWEGEYTYFVGHARFVQEIVIKNENYQISGSYSYQVCTDVDGKCIPFEDDFELVSNSEKGTSKLFTDKKKDDEGLLKEQLSTDPYTIFSFMIVAFLAGLTALLTPCVFPMIPMTVSFFTGKNKSKKESIFKSLFYGFSIISDLCCYRCSGSSLYGARNCQ